MKTPNVDNVTVHTLVSLPEPDTPKVSNHLDHSKVMKTVMTLIEEQGVVKAHTTFQSQTMRDGLYISDETWSQLDPQLKSKIMEVGKEIEAAHKANSPAPSPRSLPNQFFLLNVLL